MGEPCRVCKIFSASVPSLFPCMCKEAVHNECLKKSQQMEKGAMQCECCKSRFEFSTEGWWYTSILWGETVAAFFGMLCLIFFNLMCMAITVVHFIQGNAKEYHWPIFFLMISLHCAFYFSEHFKWKGFMRWVYILVFVAIFNFAGEWIGTLLDFYLKPLHSDILASLLLGSMFVYLLFTSFNNPVRWDIRQITFINNNKRKRT